MAATTGAAWPTCAAARSYERERKAAMLPMSLATDGLQQLFSRTENPLQTLRNWGMRGFERNGLLKDWIVRQAMGTHDARALRQQPTPRHRTKHRAAASQLLTPSVMKLIPTLLAAATLALGLWAQAQESSHPQNAG